MDWIPWDEFEHLAKSIPIGTVRKFRHTCGSRESMAVGNEPTHWWAYCHRCRRSGKRDKQHVFDVVPKPPLPRYAPKDLRELRPEDVLDFGARRKQYDRWLVKYMTQLRYSPSFKRVYLPNSSNEGLGYDVTGKADAAWYGTVKTSVVAPLPQGNCSSAGLYWSPEEYFAAPKSACKLLVLDRGAYAQALAKELLQHGVQELRSTKHVPVLQRELNVHNIEVLNYD